MTPEDGGFRLGGHEDPRQADDIQILYSIYYASQARPTNAVAATDPLMRLAYGLGRGQGFEMTIWRLQDIVPRESNPRFHKNFTGFFLSHSEFNAACELIRKNPEELKAQLAEQPQA